MSKDSLELSVADQTMLVGVALLIPAYVSEYYGVQAVRADRDFDKNPHMPQIADGIIALAFTMMLLPLRWYLFPRFQSLAPLMFSEYKLTKPYRVYRLGRSLFNLMYFVTMTIVGYMILHKEPWFPKSLGGSGDIHLALVADRQAPRLAVRLYVLFQFAFQLHNFIDKILLPFDSQTVETLIHDLVSMLLIGSSYLGNFVAIGTIISFINDASDVFEFLYLSTVDTDKRPIVMTTYLLMLGSWMYLRLIVFPFQCVYNTVSYEVLGRFDLPSAFITPINCVLVVLLVLQTYWFYLFTTKARRVLLWIPKEKDLIAMAALQAAKKENSTETTSDSPVNIVAVNDSIKDAFEVALCGGRSRTLSGRWVSLVGANGPTRID